MNQAIKAVLCGFLAAGLLLGSGSIAEEPMLVAGEVEAAELPEDYEGAIDFLEGLFSSVTETEVPQEPTPAPTAVPVPTEIPMETESPYTVAFTLPNGWTNAARGTVTIQITDPSGMGLQSMEYKTGSGWMDITAEYFSSRNGSINISVTDNGTIAVRLTDPHGRTFEESESFTVFDRTEPSMRTWIDGEKLRVQAEDTASGVAGVQVNGLLFTEVENGALEINIPDVLKKYDHLAVRAFDYAGNFTNPVTLDNPFYTEPTAEPQRTPGTSPAATATAAPPAATETPYVFPAVTSAPVNPTAEPTPQIIYVQPEATPTPIVETEYITIGPGMPYLADGNGHTLDVLYSAATNKQFITMQTKSGNVFYLVIDYDKPIDEDAEMYETYFLNLVDERDLMSLMSEEEMPTATPQVIYVTPEPTSIPAPTQAPTPVPAEPEAPEKPEKSQMTGIIALVLILAAGGGTAYYFLKVKGKGTASKSSGGYDLDDDEDEDEEEDEKTDTEA